MILVLAGTGGGKTSFAPLWCLEEHRRRIAEGEEAPCGLVLAPYKILVRTTKPVFLRLFEEKLGLGEWENKQDGIWRFHEGGYVYFATADSPESIEGAHVHWAWMDEYGQRQFKENAFRALERRVRFHSGRILGTTTPYVLGWLKILTDAHKEGRRPDIDLINFPSTANPKFPKDEFERARKTLPPWQFRMFYEGQWDRPTGLIYSAVTEDHWTNLEDMPSGWENFKQYGGLDFGFNNPTAMPYGALGPDDVLYIFDEYYETERTDAENAKSAPKHKVEMVWADPSAPEAITEFMQQGWKITKCPKHDVISGILEVIERLNTMRLKFVRNRLEHVPRELDSYVWDERTADKPVKAFDHTMDALRYMCWGLRNKPQPLGDQRTSSGRSHGLKTQYGGTGSGSRLAGLPGASRR